MGGASDSRVYYVISDLHIGGDEQLGEVEFREEVLAFLARLETTDEDAELVINGDAFGLWEITTVEGIAKFDELVETYPELFDQLRATGANVPITLIPGNHDHELAAYDAYVDRFAAYNVTLVQEESMTARSATAKSTSSTATGRTRTTASRTGAIPTRRRWATTTTRS
jgi:UDP-2,3-diacylglucosamine pyrophosphatase LpxH